MRSDDKEDIRVYLFCPLFLRSFLLSLFRCLIESGSDVNAKDLSGDTPLAAALYCFSNAAKHHSETAHVNSMDDDDDNNNHNNNNNNNNSNNDGEKRKEIKEKEGNCTKNACAQESGKEIFNQG